MDRLEMNSTDLPSSAMRRFRSSVISSGVDCSDPSLLALIMLLLGIIAHMGSLDVDFYSMDPQMLASSVLQSSSSRGSGEI